jgi:multicomponent Na+:H+ antiporter subunit B
VTKTVRNTVLLIAAALAAVLLLTATSDLPAFGAAMSPYADALDRSAVIERACANAVTSVVFDQRGFDTLGEGFILFCAVIGILALTREEPDERFVAPVDHAPRRRRSRTSDAVRVFGLGFVVVTATAGLQMIFHGEPTPGGGFQGGVLLAAALAALYACGSVPRFMRAMRPAHVVEAVGAFSYPALGFAGLVLAHRSGGGTFLANVLPLGTVSHLWSGGTILFLNVGVGVAVCAAIAGLLVAFLDQLRLRVVRDDERGSDDGKDETS